MLLTSRTCHRALFTNVPRNVFRGPPDGTVCGRVPWTFIAVRLASSAAGDGTQDLTGSRLRSSSCTPVTSKGKSSPEPSSTDCTLCEPSPTDDDAASQLRNDRVHNDGDSVKSSSLLRPQRHQVRTALCWENKEHSSGHRPYTRLPYVDVNKSCKSKTSFKCLSHSEYYLHSGGIQSLNEADNDHDYTDNASCDKSHFDRDSGDSFRHTLLVSPDSSSQTPQDKSALSLSLITPMCGSVLMPADREETQDDGVMMTVHAVLVSSADHRRVCDGLESNGLVEVTTTLHRTTSVTTMPAAQQNATVCTVQTDAQMAEGKGTDVQVTEAQMTESPKRIAQMSETQMTEAQAAQAEARVPAPNVWMRGDGDTGGTLTVVHDVTSCAGTLPTARRPFTTPAHTDQPRSLQNPSPALNPSPSHSSLPDPDPLHTHHPLPNPDPDSPASQTHQPPLVLLPPPVYYHPPPVPCYHPPPHPLIPFHQGQAVVHQPPPLEVVPSPPTHITIVQQSPSAPPPFAPPPRSLPPMPSVFEADEPLTLAGNRSTEITTTPKANLCCCSGAEVRACCATAQ